MRVHPLSISSGVRLAWLMLKQTVKQFFADNGLFLASGLAFNLLLYSVPLALLMISLLGYTVLDSERAVHEVQSVLQRILPRSQQALAENLGAIVANRGLLGAAGGLSFFVFSSTLFGSVRIVLNLVFQAGQPRGFLEGIGRDILMMLLTAALLALAIGAVSVLTFVQAFGNELPLLSLLPQPGLAAASKLLGVVLTSTLLYVLYRFSPARSLSHRALLVASVTGTLLYQLAMWGFAWYVFFAQDTIALYGALGGLLFFLLWLYYAAAVFIVGAEVGWAYHVLAERRR
jgi:membrane protein